MATAVTLTGVVKEYSGKRMQPVRVLHGIDLAVAGGEFLALMGPSGSGKSTLLNLIAGLDLVTEGTVVVGERRIGQLSRSDLAKWRARHIGFVFQGYNLLPTMTALSNVSVPLLLTDLSSSERSRRAHAALTLVGLADRAEHKPGEMSGGQQQRVAIARAIVSDPALLICDEPTGDLDRENADAVLDLLSALGKTQDKTIIMVTHDPLAAGRASRTVHLEKGRIAANGAGSSH